MRIANRPDELTRLCLSGADVRLPNSDLEGGPPEACHVERVYLPRQVLCPIRCYTTWLNHVLVTWCLVQTVPGLALSRTIGDKIAATVGVTSTPEITKHRLHASDRFVVIASDGLWKVGAVVACMMFLRIMCVASRAGNDLANGSIRRLGRTAHLLGRRAARVCELRSHAAE